METSLQRLSENIVYLPADEKTDRPILAAISGDKKTLLIDAGNSPAHVALFLRELDRNRISRGDYVVITRWHWDHSFGISALNLPTIISTMKDYDGGQDAFIAKLMKMLGKQINQDDLDTINYFINGLQ